MVPALFFLLLLDTTRAFLFPTLRCRPPPPPFQNGLTWRRRAAVEGGNDSPQSPPSSLPPSPQPQNDDDEEEEDDIIMRYFQEITDVEKGDDEDGKGTTKASIGPRPYFQDLALMAEAAAEMPVDFLLHPELAYYSLGGEMPTCRIITGTWQLDGKHGYHPFFLDVKKAVRAMVRQDGYTTFDVAPFYGQVERWLGDVRLKIEDPQELAAYKIFTKLVFPPTQERFLLVDVETAVDGALERLRAQRLDLVQLHWWNFEDDRYLDVLHYLQELQDKGKVRHIGVTNFGAVALARALESGVPIVANQVQYSVLDRRPATARHVLRIKSLEEQEDDADRESKYEEDEPRPASEQVSLADVCLKHNVTLLCYGTLLGGFLSDRWLGAPEPDPRAFTSASEEKYWEIMRAWGTWEQFQELLAEFKAVARKHRSSIAHVGLRWVLDQPAVGSVVVGARLGYMDHLEANKEVLKLALTRADRENIVRAAATGRDLAVEVGDVGVEYTRAVMEVPEKYQKSSRE